jgi:hypothetical protein
MSSFQAAKVEEKKEEPTEQDKNGEKAPETEPAVAEDSPAAEEEEAEAEGASAGKDDLDIDKVLAETSVPELSSDIENVVKKSVKFSPHLSKEIALKTIRVMQPDSNLIDPEDVDDEFAFTEEPK